MAAFDMGTTSRPLPQRTDADYWHDRTLAAEAEVRRLADRLGFALILGRACAHKADQPFTQDEG